MLFYKKTYFNKCLSTIAKKFVLGAVAIGFSSLLTHANLDHQVVDPSISITPSPPELNVGAYVLLDYNSGQVIAEKKMHESLPPASLTKLMTSYIAQSMIATGKIKETDMVTISKKAWKTEGSTMFLEPNEKVSLIDLLKGLIVVSGNDAAVAIAEYIAGSEDAFVQVMNHTAKKLGLQNTHFQDVNGLPNDKHYSSAYDIAKLSWHIIHDFPKQYGLYSIKEFQHGVEKRTGQKLSPQSNRLNLLWMNQWVDGLKTGHTQAAGYCLAASAIHGERRVIAVILKSTSNSARDAEAQKLITYGYRFFDDVRVLDQGVIDKMRVWKGQASELPVGLKNTVWVTVPKGESHNVKKEVTLKKNLQAPININEQVGTLKVLLNDKVINESPIIAQMPIKQGSFLKRVWDSILMFFNKLF